MSAEPTRGAVGAGKVIITCALTGAIHTPSMSPYLPVTPEQITAEAIAASEAGAAILHLHARDPETGKPDQSPEAFARMLPTIKAATGAVLNITTGGSPYMLVEERLKPAAAFRPELASLNMGSFNFGLYQLLDKYRDFEHEWERAHLEATRELIFKNTFADIEVILQTCSHQGTRFEFECYDIGHLYTLAHFVARGLVTPPYFVQSIFGILGGIGAHPEDVAHMRRTAERLFGADLRWSVLGAGAAQLRIAAQSVALGGHLRVGLEDSLWAGKGRLATTNAEQVELAVKIVRGLGLDVASPDEARAILDLKGADTVGF
ncbi:MAG: 3-keto-5-aminohexanoate cleavage protein [Trueperaceae bacterium]|nr:MAG: 3-keto-5-aminohexanoate cleavage protein [Trueperaceae bacterium]